MRAGIGAWGWLGGRAPAKTHAGPHPGPNGSRYMRAGMTGDEVLVFFELLPRWISDERKPTPEDGCFESTSEIAVLHGIVGDL